MIRLRPYIYSPMKVFEKVRARWNCLIRPRPYHYPPMTEPSLLHNRRARGDCSKCISSYTLRDTQLDENNLKWVHVWSYFSHKVP